MGFVKKYKKIFLETFFQKKELNEDDISIKTISWDFGYKVYNPIRIRYSGDCFLSEYINECGYYTDDTVSLEGYADTIPDYSDVLSIISCYEPDTNKIINLY